MSKIICNFIEYQSDTKLPFIENKQKKIKVTHFTTFKVVSKL